MSSQDFTITILADQTPTEVFNAINNVRGWWSEEIEGNTVQLNDEFSYHYQDVHRCRMKIVESVPGKRVVWQVLDNYFSFTKDKTEWINTRVIFEIYLQEGKAAVRFTHEGLVPAYECYSACVNGWSQYIQQSLQSLITTGKGQPNAAAKATTTHEVAARFNELARQEKWFDIQDELFSDDVKSMEPANSPYFSNVSGKVAVRKKGEDWVSKIEAAHRRYTTEPVVAGKHFVVGREVDITVQGYGRIQLNELMLYEVRDGKIVLEQFFY